MAFSYICDGLALVNKLYGTKISEILEGLLRSTQYPTSIWIVPKLRKLEVLGRYLILCDRETHFCDFLKFAGLDFNHILVRHRHLIDNNRALMEYKHLYDRPQVRSQTYDTVRYELKQLFGYQIAQTVVDYWLSKVKYIWIHGTISKY